MIEGVAVGRPAVKPPVSEPRVGAGRRRGEARTAGSGLGTALTATFLGLLLVHPGSGAEGSQERPPVPPEEGTARVAGEEAGERHEAAASTQELAATPVAAGSVLTAGAVIDPAVLTRLGGEARFDEAALRLLRPEAVTVPLDGGTAPAAPPATVTIALAPPTQVELPAVETPAEPGEDLGPIGDEIVGGEGGDVLVGGPDDDLIDGGGGDDTIAGGGGDDILEGGEGDDAVDGGEGDDSVGGGSGDDVLQGGEGRDVLDGGSGQDSLDGGAGDDTMIGGTGDDSAVVGGPGDLVFEDPWGPDAGGRDTLVVAPDFGAQLEKVFPTLAKGGVATFMIGDAVLGSPPADAPTFKQQVAPNVENVRLTGAEAHAVVGDGNANTIEGNDAANRLWGGAGDDKIRGGAGDDRLYGQDGDDLLLGDAGDDLLEGGAGDDLLYGGAGDDVYVLGLAETGVDRIFDFEGSNRIRFEGADPSRLSVRYEGDDLHLAHDDRDVAVVVGHRGREGSLAGIEIDGELHETGEFLRPVQPPTDDLLSRFLDPDVGTAPVPIDGRTWLAEPVGSGLAETSSGLSEIFPGADLWTADLPDPMGEPSASAIVAAAGMEERAGPTGGR
jgi:hypothetical protein